MATKVTRVVIVANKDNVAFVPLEPGQTWKDGEKVADYLRTAHSEELDHATIRQAYSINGTVVPLKVYNREEVGFD